MEGGNRTVKKMLALCMAMLLSLAMLAGWSSADPNHPSSI